MASTVYFLNDRAGKAAESIQNKGLKVLRDAGIKDLIKEGDRVGIKVHMGEWGNSLNLRPHWVSSVVEEVKRLGGHPCIIEGAVIPGGLTGSRNHAADHRRTAAHHGFTEETLGCPIVFCDGEYGLDDLQVPVKNGVYMKYTHMGKYVADFDKIIVVSHFKGHGMGVFGGAIKNIGIGLASARGKLSVHFLTNHTIGFKKMELNPDAVAAFQKAPHPNLVDIMVHTCPCGAFSMDGDIVAKDGSKCNMCGYCFTWMVLGMYKTSPALLPTWAPAIADSACGIIDAVGKENWMYLNYAMDITPGCDCNAYHDKTMIPNIGVFASRDPVAVDMACIEAAEGVYAVPGSIAEDYGFSEPNTERFTNCSSMAKISQWAQLNSAVFNGMGTTEYTLVKSEVVDGPEFRPPMYKPTETFFSKHKDFYAKVDMDPGDYSYDVFKPRLPYEKFSLKPTGKVAEMSLKDHEA